jgi:hypothetical protein
VRRRIRRPIWLDDPTATFDEARVAGRFTLAARLDDLATEHEADGPLGLVVAELLRDAAAAARRRGLLTATAWLADRARRQGPPAG